MQDLALSITLILLLVLLASFVWVLRRTRGARPIEELAPRAYRARTYLFWLACAVGLVVSVVTLRPWPHDAEAKDVTRHIDAQASQWAWNLSDQQVTLGEVIEFRVGSADVNHGFGLYDPENKLVAQIQAMPGFVNKVRHRFDRPGVYNILCLEYCGLAHHGMAAQITVNR